jgi:hypothetical protein
MQNITVENRKADTDAQITREHRFAYGERGGCADLQVSREHGKYTVIWNVNRGRGWRTKNWRASGLTHEKAEAFADEKWAALIEWLKNLEPEQRGNGAVAAFSAQVASMWR